MINKVVNPFLNYFICKYFQKVLKIFGITSFFNKYKGSELGMQLIRQT
jgi:hypothetical protein